MVVLSTMGNLLFGPSSKNFSSFSRSFLTLLYHYRAPRAAGKLHSGSDFSCPAFLSLPFTLFLLWTALVHTSHAAVNQP